MGYAPLPLLLALYPVYYLSCFVHEVGHAVMAWLTGYTVGSFGLGTANPFWVANCWGTRVYCCRTRPLQGMTFVFHEQLYPSRWQEVGWLAGGVLAHGVLATAALTLWWNSTGWPGLWLVAATLNGLLVAVNLLPYSFRVGKFSLRSDGALLFDTVRWGGEDPSPLAIIRMVKGLRGLWRSVGDLRTLRLYLLAAAQAELDLGVVTQADRLWREAEELPALQSRCGQAYGALVRCLMAIATGNVQAGRQALEAARKQFDAAQHEVGLVLVALAEVELLLAEGNARGAVPVLEGLAHQPVLARRRQLREALFLVRLSVAAALPDPAAVEDLRAAYLAARRARTLTRDLHFYRTLAGYYTARAEWSEAAEAYRGALAAAAQLYLALADPEEQGWFREAQAPWVAEAERCLQRLGAAEPIDLEAIFPQPGTMERPGGQPVTLPALWPLRFTILLAFLNLLAALAILASCAWMLERGLVSRLMESPRAWQEMAGIQLLASGLVFVGALCLTVLGGRAPTLQRGGGMAGLGLLLLLFAVWGGFLFAVGVF
jgi:hypothetical protein